MGAKRRTIGDYTLLDGGKTGGQGIVHRAVPTDPGAGADRCPVLDDENAVERCPVAEGGHTSGRCPIAAGGGAAGACPVVAVKAFFYVGDDPSSYAAFSERCRQLVKLSHPNIVRYLDHFVTDEDQPRKCLVMEYLEGETLHDRLARLAERGQRGLPWEEAVGIFEQTIEALQYARREWGMSHGDIKPENIFIVKDDAGESVRILDFDVARQATADPDSADVLRRASFAITPLYAAPELLLDKRLEPTVASDVYSLAVSLYETITGRYPFAQTQEGAAEDPFRHGIFRVLTRDAKELLAKGWEKEQSARLNDLGEFLERLRAVKPRRISGKTEYILKRLVASGGFGEVYEATRADNGETVAVKFLYGNAYSTRFMREAKILEAAEHPNIVRYHDFIEIPERREMYLVLEYLPNMPDWSLAGRITAARQKGGMDIGEVLQLFNMYCQALHHLHLGCGQLKRSIIHRDIKPANLYAPPDNPEDAKLFDLGIARDSEALSHAAAGVPGTPNYMAPELVTMQAKARRGMPQSDVFSLGLCLYEALAGRPALPRLPSDHNKAMLAACERAISKKAFPEPTYDVEPFRSRPYLADIIRKTAAWSPAKRYANVAEMRHEICQALRKYVSGREDLTGEENTVPSVLPDTMASEERQAIEASRRWAWRQRVRTFGLGAGVAAAAAIVVVGLVFGFRWGRTHYALRETAGELDRIAQRLDRPEAAADAHALTRACDAWIGRDTGQRAAWEALRGRAVALTAEIPAAFSNRFVQTAATGTREDLARLRDEWLTVTRDLPSSRVEANAALTAFMNSQLEDLAARQRLHELTATARQRLQALTAAVPSSLPDPASGSTNELLRAVVELEQSAVKLLTFEEDNVAPLADPRLRETLQGTQTNINVLFRTWFDGAVATATNPPPSEHKRGLSHLLLGLGASARTLTGNLRDHYTAQCRTLVAGMDLTGRKAERLAEAQRERAEAITNALQAFEAWTSILNRARNADTLADPGIPKSVLAELRTTADTGLASDIRLRPHWQALRSAWSDMVRRFMTDRTSPAWRSDALGYAERLLENTNVTAVFSSVVPASSAIEDLRRTLASENERFLVVVANRAPTNIVVSSSLASIKPFVVAAGETEAKLAGETGATFTLRAAAGEAYEDIVMQFKPVPGGGTNWVVSGFRPRPVTLTLVWTPQDGPPVTMKYCLGKVPPWHDVTNGTPTLSLPPGTYGFDFGRPDYTTDNGKLAMTLDFGNNGSTFTVPPSQVAFKPSPALQTLLAARGDAGRRPAIFAGPDPEFLWPPHAAEFADIRREYEGGVGGRLDEADRRIAAVLRWRYQVADPVLGTYRDAAKAPAVVLALPDVSAGAPVAPRVRRLQLWAEALKNPLDAERGAPALAAQLERLATELAKEPQGADTARRLRFEAAIMANPARPPPTMSGEFPEVLVCQAHRAYRAGFVENPGCLESLASYVTSMHLARQAPVIDAFDAQLAVYAADSVWRNCAVDPSGMSGPNGELVAEKIAAANKIRNSLRTILRELPDAEVPRLVAGLRNGARFMRGRDPNPPLNVMEVIDADPLLGTPALRKEIGAWLSGSDGRAIAGSVPADVKQRGAYLLQGLGLSKRP